MLYLLTIFGLSTACTIDLTLYPELHFLEKHKNGILSDLNIAIGRKWFELPPNPPEFYQMLYDAEQHGVEKTRFALDSIQSHLNADPDHPAWKAYPLMFHGKWAYYSRGLTRMVDLLESIPGIKHAGFSCFEPGAIAKFHVDANPDTYRFHFPLIIPEGDCRFEAGGVVYAFDQPRLFDDGCRHRAWNKTPKNRFLLILDMYRKGHQIAGTCT